MTPGHTATIGRMLTKIPSFPTQPSNKRLTKEKKLGRGEEEGAEGRDGNITLPLSLVGLAQVKCCGIWGKHRKAAELGRIPFHRLC